MAAVAGVGERSGQGRELCRAHLTRSLGWTMYPLAWGRERFCVRFAIENPIEKNFSSKAPSYNTGHGTGAHWH